MALLIQHQIPEDNMQYLLQRLSEPSTYAALSVVLGIVGIQMPEGLTSAMVSIFTGISAAAAILLPEKSVQN